MLATAYVTLLLQRSKLSDEFKTYTERLFEGIDPHADERQELRQKLHTHPDGGSTERVVAVIDAIRKDRPIGTIEDVDTV